MSRRLRNIFANLTSTLLTVGLLGGIAAFVLYQKDQVISFNPISTNTGAQEPMAQSERIDEKQVEQELNKIAEEKRLKEAAAKKAAEEVRRKKEAAAKAERERIAKEKAQQEEAERIRLEKAANIKKAQEEKARQAQAQAEAQAKEKELAIARQKQEEAAKKEAQEAKQKAEAERQRKETEAKAEAARQAQISAANEAKINAALSGAYIGQVHNYIYQNWQPTMGAENYATIIAFKVDQNGRVQGTPTIKRSSGNGDFDESVIMAIMRASPLPMPNEPLARQRLARDGFEVEFIPKNFF